MLAALAPFGWPFELFVHFRWQLAAAAAMVVVACVSVRRPSPVVLVALAVAVLAQTFSLYSATHGPVDTAANAGCTGPTLRVASVNLWFRNDDPERVLAWLRAHPADVVVLQELTPAWQRTFAATLDEYEHRFLISRRDPYGIGVLSRIPLEHVRAVDFAGDGLPSIVTELAVGESRVQLVGLHTHWPMTPRLQFARDLSLRNVAREVRQSPLPSIATGDLNLTPYAPAFAPLLADSGLRDAFAGLRWRPTWSASFWPLALPIDHVLVPPDACVVTSTIGSDVGSDHRPIHVTLRLRR